MSRTTNALPPSSLGVSFCYGNAASVAVDPRGVAVTRTWKAASPDAAFETARGDVRYEVSHLGITVHGPHDGTVRGVNVTHPLIASHFGLGFANEVAPPTFLFGSDRTRVADTAAAIFVKIGPQGFGYTDGEDLFSLDRGILAPDGSSELPYLEYLIRQGTDPLNPFTMIGNLGWARFLRFLANSSPQIIIDEVTASMLGDPALYANPAKARALVSRLISLAMSPSEFGHETALQVAQSMMRMAARMIATIADQHPGRPMALQWNSIATNSFPFWAVRSGDGNLPTLVDGLTKCVPPATWLVGLDKSPIIEAAGAAAYAANVPVGARA